ncbi:geranylgeranyl reductase family protein [Chloroflexota bacterium]
MRHDYEVIIVGAGPAGATLAYELAKKGIRVLLLEKETLPRYKCCAGGVSVGAAKLLSVDIHELAEDVVSSATISFKGDSPYLGRHDQALMYTVMRDRFDHALVRRAEEAGAVLVQGQEVRQIQTNAKGIKVLTPAGDFRALYVAGADGAHSAVARELRLKNNSSYLAAIETEVLVPEEELTRWRSQIAIDLGCVPGGYAWVFPKLDHLSIGIACLSSKAKGLRQRYWEFLDSLNITHHSITKWSGSLIPRCGRDVVASRGRVALLGDAAGLIDPLTGEGIYNAVWSAQLAAPVIEESLQHGRIELENYQQAIEEKIIPEIRIARVLSRLFVQFPSMVFNMLNREERVWRGCCYLLRREIDYNTIIQRLGGFRSIYTLLSRI